MNKKLSMIFSMLLLTFGFGSASADVERVTSVTVSNPAAFMATLEQYLSVGEGEATSVTLLRHLHDDTDPSTHTVVAIYDDIESLERTMNTQATSAAWATVGRSAQGSSKVNSSALAIQRKTWGNNSWNEGDYLTAVLVNSPDEAAWLTAMDELNRARTTKNPGMLRIVRLRGAPATHAVLIVAPTYAGLINFMEATEASEPFAKMRGATETKTVGSTIYQVAKVWKP